MERAGIEKCMVIVPPIHSSLVISRNSECNFSHILVILHIFLSLFSDSPILSVGGDYFQCPLIFSLGMDGWVGRWISVYLEKEVNFLATSKCSL